MSIQKINEHLLTYPESKTTQLTVSSKQETGSLYHISKDTSIKSFTPRFSKRQMSTEDITIARVVCAPTIYGCVLAYSSIHSDYTAFENKKVDKDSIFKGGYVVYEIDYEYNLNPSKKLVPDVKNTDEKWLVSYSEETREYPAKKIAKFFVEQFMYKPTENKLPTIESILFIEVMDSSGLKLSTNHKLDKGFYKVELPIWDHESWSNLSFDKDSMMKIEPIDYDQYKDSKNKVASLLSEVPEYLNW